MIEKPSDNELIALLGAEVVEIWKEICANIESKYDINIAWNNGGKAWKYECKYLRAAKTLCGLLC